jgi:hypothetical protein
LKVTKFVPRYDPETSEIVLTGLEIENAHDGQLRFEPKMLEGLLDLVHGLPSAFEIREWARTVGHRIVRGEDSELWTKDGESSYWLIVSSVAFEDAECLLYSLSRDRGCHPDDIARQVLARRRQGGTEGNRGV